MVKEMNRFKKSVLFLMMAVAVAGSLQSCNDNDKYIDVDDYTANAVVTVKSDNNSTYFQLDDSTTLLPVNVKSKLFGGKEVRAIANIVSSKSNPGIYDKAVYVNWIDSIRTKGTVETLGSAEKNEAAYGKDPFEIMADWFTIAEDGYLTLRVRTLWGSGSTHYINMITGVNSENPYEVEIRQDSKGDTGKKVGDSLIAFNLNALPDTQGKTVKLKVNWISFSGNKSVEFDYCTRKSTSSGSFVQGQYVMTLK